MSKMWAPWRGCHRCSTGCKYCYIHKGDARRGVDTDSIVRSERFYAPVEKKKRSGEYRYAAGELVYVCFSSDFLIEEADEWRGECWDIMRKRNDLHFLFLTKRIHRFAQCAPEDWGEGYDNVTIGCTVEDQQMADERLAVFSRLPIKHKNIICQPLIGPMDISKYLDGVELVVVGGESDRNARTLDYDWVLDICRQCADANVKFEFRQCGTHFLKDGKLYTLPVRQLMSQARKANINT